MKAIMLRITEDQLQTFKVLPDLFEDFLKTPLETESCYLDKTWDAVHHVFTGVNLDDFESLQPPLKYLMFSNQYFDEEQDMGYGPAHYILPEQVKAVNTIISDMNTETLVSNYNPQKLRADKVYLRDWKSPEMKAIVLHYCNELKTFYSKAAKNGDGIVTYIY